jgi:hypothetical protein
LIVAGWPHIRVALLYHALAVMGLVLAWLWIFTSHLRDHVAWVLLLLCIALWAFTVRIEKTRERHVGQDN